MTSLALPFLIGVTGMAIDIGRMYITKGEAQHFADAAAIAGALKLDGTTSGITSAKSAVSSCPLRYGFGQTAFTSSNITTSFATSSGGTYTTSPPDPPTNYNYVKVLAQVNLSMTLMRLLIGNNATIAASSIAGWQTITSLTGGEFPFSPYTRKGYVGAVPDNASDPYGYSVGGEYTLRWGAPGNRTSCGTDGSVPNLSSNGSIRGYCCVAESAASLREAIVGGKTDPIAVGASVPMDNGAKNTEMSAIADRANEDTDTTSTTYAQYISSGTGNGMRVVVVPVNGGPPNYINQGFAAFFLETPSSYSGLHGNDSACALYLGQWREGQNAQPSGGTGAAHVRLLQ